MFDFTRDLAVKRSSVEGFNAGNTAAAFQQGLPRVCRGIADGGNEADARDYDSAGNKGLSLLSLIAQFLLADNRASLWIAGAVAGGSLTRGRQLVRFPWRTSPLTDAGSRRGDAARALLLLVFDVGDGVADSSNLFRVFVGNFQFESFFEGHDEFHDIQGVGAEVIDERCLVIDLALVHTQLLYDDLLDLLFYC
jgi:hypothetical protein